MRQYRFTFFSSSTVSEPFGCHKIRTVPRLKTSSSSSSSSLLRNSELSVTIYDFIINSITYVYFIFFEYWLAHSVWAILQFCLLGKGRELRVLVHSEFLALITKHINVKFKSRSFTANRFYFFFLFSFFYCQKWETNKILY